MIGTNLHKPSSAIHREVFVFRVIPVFQADLNEFMRTWNCQNIRKSAEAPGGVPEMLFNLMGESMFCAAFLSKKLIC